MCAPKVFVFVNKIELLNDLSTWLSAATFMAKSKFLMIYRLGSDSQIQSSLSVRSRSNCSTNIQQHSHCQVARQKLHPSKFTMSAYTSVSARARVARHHRLDRLIAHWHVALQFDGRGDRGVGGDRPLAPCAQAEGEGHVQVSAVATPPPQPPG